MADTLRFVVSTTSVAIRSPGSTQENQVVSNVGPGTAYLGQATGVTTSTGVPFPPGSELRILKNSLPLWAIAAAGSPANIVVVAGVQAT